MGVLASAEPLTISSFAPFGSIISPNEEVAKLDDSAKNANQGTAIKILQVSKIEKGLPFQNAPNWNLFRCFPQSHLKRSFQDSNVGCASIINHPIRVLEKHPHSSQTFLPMGRLETEISYLVVVALEERNTAKPDLSTLKAFTCKGNQAVTYGAGIWHAPMIVLGQLNYVDFGVLIYEVLDQNCPQEDCVEEHYAETDIAISLFST